MFQDPEGNLQQGRTPPGRTTDSWPRRQQQKVHGFKKASSYGVREGPRQKTRIGSGGIARYQCRNHAAEQRLESYP